MCYTVSMPEGSLKNKKDWTRFRKPLCASCWASCCNSAPVEVSVPDLIRMELLSEAEAAQDLDRAVAKLAEQRLIRRARRGALVFVLRQRRNGDCIFLDEKRRCTTYETRPEICRMFPRIGPRPGFCPYEPKDAS